MRWCAAVGVALLFASAAHAAPPTKAAKKPVAAPPGAPPAKPAAGAAPAESDETRVARLLLSMRKALAAAPKPDEPMPLADALVATLANLSVVNVLHGHFALSGVGQALRAGGMPSEVAGEFARNMRDSWKALAADFQRLSELRAFDAELRDMFRILGVLEIGRAHV